MKKTQLTIFLIFLSFVGFSQTTEFPKHTITIGTGIGMHTSDFEGIGMFYGIGYKRPIANGRLHLTLIFNLDIIVPEYLCKMLPICISRA